MNDVEDFVVLLREEVGLPIERSQLTTDLDNVPAWDSLLLLKLVVALERETGRRMPVGRLMAMRSLQDMYELVAAA
ncbi:MAG TPA: phosphopantetheine-binding protein [Jatrophihabitantaceae bacterium]|jgi:acyl carrier protein